MNRVILIGRFTCDPEIRYSGGSNMAVAKFSLAVPRKFKKDNEPDCDFINCTSFGKTAEVIEKTCQKGKQIAVYGRIQTGSFTNKDGKKVYTTDVIVDGMEFVGSKNDGVGAAERENAPATTMNDGFMHIPDTIDEELPFN